jgi:hypothetical protein
MGKTTIRQPQVGLSVFREFPMPSFPKFPLPKGACQTIEDLTIRKCTFTNRVDGTFVEHTNYVLRRDFSGIEDERHIGIERPISTEQFNLSGFWRAFWLRSLPDFISFTSSVARQFDSVLLTRQCC